MFGSNFVSSVLAMHDGSVIAQEVRQNDGLSRANWRRLSDIPVKLLIVTCLGSLKFCVHLRGWHVQFT